jgi:hypothetical protein
MNNEYAADEYRRFAETMRPNGLKQVQQMVYLRENINK